MGMWRSYVIWWHKFVNKLVISNIVKISGPNRSAKITDHFTFISINVIYCVSCTLCKIYIGETGRKLADRFREHLRDAEENDTDAFKPVASRFNLRIHSHHNITLCGLSLHHGNTESRKSLEQKFIFQLVTLYPDGINEWTPLIPLIYSQIHVSKSLPMAKFLHTPT